MKLGWLPGATALIAASLMSAGVAAQSGQPAPASAAQAATPAPTPPPAPATPPATEPTANDPSGLNIPADVTFIGNREPDVRKATAIVNGQVITETDINQRLALFLASNRIQLPPDQVQAARAQVLRNLIDETLEIQAAAQEEINIRQSEIDDYYSRFSQNFNKTPAEMSEYLRSINSSERSMKRQIMGEIAWQRLQQRRINPFVDVGDDEVQAVLARLQASRGTTEYHVAEIFLTATPETASEVEAIANRIIQEYMAPRFRAGDYAGGIAESTAMLVKLIEGEPLPEPVADNPAGHRGQGGGGWMVALVVGFVAASIARGIFAAAPRPIRALLSGAAAGGAALLLTSLFFASGLAGLIGLLLGLSSGTPGRFVRHGGWGGWGGGGFGGGGWGGGGGFGGGGGWGGGGGSSGGGGASGSW